MQLVREADIRLDHGGNVPPLPSPMVIHKIDHSRYLLRLWDNICNGSFLRSKLCHIGLTFVFLSLHAVVMKT